jgi:alpha-amylase
MKKLTALFVFAISFFNALNLNAQAAPEQYEGVALQGFYWDSFHINGTYPSTDWLSLTALADELADDFSLIWLPPSGWAGSGSTGYNQKYWFNHNSAWGTQEELINLIKTLKAKGTGAIADVVVNHRGTINGWYTFAEETYKGVTHTFGLDAICYYDEMRDSIASPKPAGAEDTGENFGGCRDLDHTKQYVRDAIKAHLDFLKNELGYVGYRWDMVKGFAPEYVGEYNVASDNQFSVGERYDHNYNDLAWWIDGTKKDNQIRSGAFDFCLKNQLKQACDHNNWGNLQYAGNPSGLIGTEGFRRFAWTFVDNHDTDRVDDERIWTNVLAANAYIISHPGIPVVFYKHWHDYKEQISEMIYARKYVKVHSQSAVEIWNPQGNDIYLAKITGKTGDLLVKVGTRYDIGFDPTEQGFVLRASGTNYAIWTKGGSAPVERLKLSVTPASGLYEGGTTATFACEGGTPPYTIYYTLNETEPTTSSATISSGATLNISQRTTLKAFAKDAAGAQTTVETRLYRTDSREPITITWRNDCNWTDSVCFYAWLDLVPDLLGAWPGLKMTPDANGFYSYTFDIEYQNVNFVIGNGKAAGKHQTVDVKDVIESGCYQILCNETSPLEPWKNLVRVSDCSTSGTKNVNVENDFSIYPNPVYNDLNIEFSTAINGQKAEITDISGKKIFSCDVQQPLRKIDVSGLSAGIYFIKIGNQIEKFIKR